MRTLVLAGRKSVVFLPLFGTLEVWINWIPHAAPAIRNPNLCLVHVRSYRDFSSPYGYDIVSVIIVIALLLSHGALLILDIG